MTAAPTPQLAISASRQFTAWMSSLDISLGFTTYQAGKVFLVGAQSETGGISIFERSLPRCMGLTVEGNNTLYISSLYQLWRFENALEPGQLHDGYDRLYVPQLGWITGDLDIHDLAVDDQGRLIFVNTLFGCLATTSTTHSFVPLWKPPFLSKLAAEDRCHLNGLALEGGRPAFVTAVSESDVADGWRDHRRDGGVVISVPEDRIVARGLSMPHSPRVYRDRLWLHDSGTGYFGFADLDAGAFQRVAFCPGYLRGLAMIGDYAVVGVSKPRSDGNFGGLALDDNLSKRKATARCGLFVVDLRNGDLVHWLRIEGIVEELYDVVVIPGVRRPKIIGFKSDEIRRIITVGSEEDRQAG